MNTITEETKEIKAEYFATISKGKIVTLAQAVPSHTLLDCQIALTKEEYDIARTLGGKLEQAVSVIKAIRAKIKANGC